MKEALAMPCTQEQAKEITELLEKNGFKISWHYDDFNIKLVNNWRGYNGHIAFVSNANDFTTRIHISLDPARFLASLGIEQPKKYRFKTQAEFEATCAKDTDGDYIAGSDEFLKVMFYLFGKEYDGTPDNLVRVDYYNITPEMIVPIEQPKTKDMKTELENIVVDNLNREFGKEIIETWKLLGVDVVGCTGNYTKRENDEYIYYGLINGKFNCYSIDFVKIENAKIITLEELKSYLPLNKQTIEEQPKWENKTSKGEIIEDVIEFNNYYIVKLYELNIPQIYNLQGSCFYTNCGNLIPYNPRKAELTAELETLQARINEIKKELNA